MRIAAKPLPSFRRAPKPMRSHGRTSRARSRSALGDPDNNFRPYVPVEARSAHIEGGIIGAADMIDLRASYNLVWDSELQPIGEGTGEKEPFDTWWERNAVRLGSARSIPVSPSNGFIATGRTHRSATLTSIAFRGDWNDGRHRDFLRKSSVLIPPTKQTWPTIMSYTAIGTESPRRP